MRRTVLMIALGLLGSTQAQADPVRAGQLSWTAQDMSAAITLQADGFTFTGEGYPIAGVFAPLACVYDTCRPGIPLDLEARWTGTDLSGTAVLDGVAYEGIDSLMSPIALDAHWVGQILPKAGTVRAPFQFEGLVYRPDGALELAGQGLATATFTRQHGGLSLTSLAYVFGSDAMSTPEPATWLLMATGMAWGWRRKAQA